MHQVPHEFQDISLDEAIQFALAHSPVIRDAGGRIVAQPDSAVTIHDVAIDYTDPVFGVEAALSQFDATLATQFNAAKNDRVFNNVTLGGGATELKQDLVTLQSQLSKVAATGTQMSLRSLTFHDRNNRLGNLFGHLWESQWEAEVRQPLLQGAGIAFNRIAGPNGQPGLRFNNGVVIAQVNQDISELDFELAVRNFISNIEEAYWQLYVAYQDFGSKQATRHSAEQTWLAVKAKLEQGLPGGEADKEAQAREQFYFHQDQSIQALNGSATSNGVYDAERRLRLLLGLDNNDGQLLRPTTAAPPRIVHDWDDLVYRAVSSRVELRKQQRRIRREELRLVAGKNFLLPRLDLTALYRVRGFGDDLTGNDGSRFSSAYADIGDLDHQEWEFGLQYNVPLGRRRAFAALRHAELRLARERSIQREQQRAVVAELATVVAREAQAHQSMQACGDRMLAAQERMQASEIAFEADRISLDLLLDAQERLSAAESRYYAAVSEYAIAEKNVRLASGELLRSHQVRLSQDDPPVCCLPARKRSDVIDYRFQIPGCR